MMTRLQHYRCLPLFALATGLVSWVPIVAGPAIENTTSAKNASTNDPVQTRDYPHDSLGLSVGPLDVQPRDSNRRFYAGTKVNRRVSVRNDADGSRNFHLRWSFGEQTGSERILLRKQGAGLVAVTLEMPDVTERTDIDFRLRLEPGGEPAADRWGLWEQRYRIWPRVRLGGVKLPAWGLSEEAEQMFRFYGIETVAVASPEALTNAPVLVVSDELLATNRPEGRAVGDWVAAGGTAFVLAGGRDDLIVPVRFAAQEPAGAQATLVDPKDPLLKSLRPDDFTLWDGGNTPGARRSFLAPPDGDFHALVETGAESGARVTPLLRAPHGNGFFLLCGLPLAERYREEPVVGILLANFLAATAQAGNEHAKVNP